MDITWCRSRGAGRLRGGAEAGSRAGPPFGDGAGPRCPGGGVRTEHCVPAGGDGCRWLPVGAGQAHSRIPLPENRLPGRRRAPFRGSAGAPGVSRSVSIRLIRPLGVHFLNEAAAKPGHSPDPGAGWLFLYPPGVANRDPAGISCNGFTVQSRFWCTKIERDHGRRPNGASAPAVG